VIIISKFSGKCDVFDSLIAINGYTDEELKNNVNIYIGDVKTPLKIENQQSLIPYYAHLVCGSLHDNKERKASIYITKESFVDREERENLEWRLEKLLTIYNRCKRKKIEFDVEEALKEIVWNGWNEEPYRKLANRVKEHGKKATVDGIHLRMHEHYRRDLVDEMIKNGLNPLRYGDYARFMGGGEQE
jgi:hypothetical protein